VKSTQMLEVNLANPSTIHEMARQAVIVVNCVGPYCFWGEIVIQACIQESAHHLDISGEVQFLEKTHLTYDKAAKEKGVYVLGACGFESILAGNQIWNDIFLAKMYILETIKAKFLIYSSNFSYSVRYGSKIPQGQVQRYILLNKIILYNSHMC